ncbi:MAG: amidase [Pseudomonadota bacterium]
MQSRRTVLKATGVALAGISINGAKAAASSGSALAANKMQSAKQMSEFGFMSAGELLELLASKAVSSVELTRYFIDRIETYDKDINAVVVRDFERALSVAKEADRALAKGASPGALHGLPMTVKESYNIAGLKTTWGFAPWKDMVAREDALVVRRYKEAGAVILGKTNVPPMLGDYQSTNEIYGQTNNPWNLERTPGGSSGGSAAALAAGMTGLESGSDIGGSLRNPAHYCGVYGHKPTWNIISMAGHAPPVVQTSREVDVAVVGPMARDPQDLKLALDLTVGPHELKNPGWKIDLPQPRAKRLQDMRVAFWHNDEAAPVTEEIEGRSRQIMALLAKAGATVSDTARPDIDQQSAAFTYLNLMQAVNASGVPESVFAQNVEAAQAFAEDDMSVSALFARASVQSHNDWVNFDVHRNQVRYAWRDFFSDWDLLVCPISNTTAFPHDHGPMDGRLVDVDGVQRPYFDASFWAGMVSLPGLPGTVFPTGPGKDGLPIGLQAISAEFHDYTTIEFARLIQQEIGGFVPPSL